jgi:hypothetical protein
MGTLLNYKLAIFPSLISPSRKTIKDELKKLRYERMVASEKALAAKVDEKTTELQQAKNEIETQTY